MSMNSKNLPLLEVLYDNDLDYLFDTEVDLENILSELFKIADAGLAEEAPAKEVFNLKRLRILCEPSLHKYFLLAERLQPPGRKSIESQVVDLLIIAFLLGRRSPISEGVRSRVKRSDMSKARAAHPRAKTSAQEAIIEQEINRHFSKWQGKSLWDLARRISKKLEDKQISLSLQAVRNRPQFKQCLHQFGEGQRQFDNTNSARSSAANSG